MHWPHLIAYFFGGVFFANAIPHFVAGSMGEPFQSPFAKPPGKGLSTSRVNVVWGWVNAVIAYILTLHIGSFDVRSLPHAAAFLLGTLAISFMHAVHFGELHGGLLKAQQ